MGSFPKIDYSALPFSFHRGVKSGKKWVISSDRKCFSKNSKKNLKIRLAIDLTSKNKF
jgi:hypothetical protein